MANTIVPLSRSYTGHAGKFSTVELREPTYKEIYIDGLGEPQQWQPGPSGQAVLITLPDVINQYVDQLAVAPTSEDLGQLNARDSRALARAVIGFFQDGPTAT
ncbi:hypothetical protein GGQ64_004336 [Rhizobium azooxidifex]|uniref:Phage tail assembly protein n=1 Tax=Mycoplana azooxidifex TaxID=1636188 RepID=A0A7W6GKW5_9HYPH|nr:hypothetical protein [Mycoplana azooxidifex]MBB3979100.1 hypothetical protein [Mycoplana azooxidifex]